MKHDPVHVRDHAQREEAALREQVQNFLVAFERRD